MIELILYILLVYGTANILVYGSIFEWLRNALHKLGEGPYSFYKLLTCMMCLPTWLGFTFSTIFIFTGNPEFSPFYSNGMDGVLLTIFFDGIFASATAWLIHTIQERIEEE